jgi:hypothetical protein
MKRKKLLPILIILRLLTNDGIFLENRRNQYKPPPAEISAAIKRPWKRGKKDVSIQDKKNQQGH